MDVVRLENLRSLADVLRVTYNHTHCACSSAVCQLHPVLCTPWNCVGGREGGGTGYQTSRALRFDYGSDTH